MSTLAEKIDKARKVRELRAKPLPMPPIHDPVLIMSKDRPTFGNRTRKSLGCLGLIAMITLGFAMGFPAGAGFRELVSDESERANAAEILAKVEKGEIPSKESKIFQNPCFDRIKGKAC